MKINDILYGLLRKALMDDPLELSLFENRTDAQWQQIFRMSKEQGVTAICFDAVRSLPKDLQPSRGLYIQWALFTEGVEKRFAHQQASLTRIREIMESEDLHFLLMKGFSVAKYYPVPKHRECGDIDIFMSADYARGNELFRKAGCRVEEDYYRHAHVVVDGIMVENHCMLSDTKARKDNIKLEQKLLSLAGEALAKAEGTLVWPPVDFSALFLNWHCEAHFMFEKIQLRHIYDWALFLKNEGSSIDLDLFRDMKKKCTFGKLSDILTSIALDFLGLEEKDVPAAILEDARSVDIGLRDRVLDYILRAERNDKTQNVWILRLKVVLRTFRDSWKFRRVFGMNPVPLLARMAWETLKEYEHKS